MYKCENFYHFRYEKSDLDLRSLGNHILGAQHEQLFNFKILNDHLFFKQSPHFHGAI